MHLIACSKKIIQAYPSGNGPHDTTQGVENCTTLSHTRLTLSCTFNCGCLLGLLLLVWCCSLKSSRTLNEVKTLHLLQELGSVLVFGRYKHGFLCLRASPEICEALRRVLCDRTEHGIRIPNASSYAGRLPTGLPEELLHQYQWLHDRQWRGALSLLQS